MGGGRTAGIQVRLYRHLIARALRVRVDKFKWGDGCAVPVFNRRTWQRTPRRRH